MAVLDDANRRQVWAHFMRTHLGPDGVNKTDLRAAIDAIDQWAEDNATSFNQAIPQPARGALSSSNKALLLAYVCMRRAGVLKVEGE